MCYSTVFLSFIKEINKCLNNGEIPFQQFNELKDFLLKRNTISRNKPLIFNIFYSLDCYKRQKCIFIPKPFPLIKSCNTKEVYLKFMEDYKKNLDCVDIERPKTIFNFFSVIKLQGILILAGLRHTTGTNNNLYPPPTEKLYEAFYVSFNKSGLTNGGRAFTKHAIRDSAHFWGEGQGKVDELNERAFAKLEEIIENSVWHNCIVLTQECFAYEIRNEAGYGARWEFKDNAPIFFRGFLEPPMENGHELRWRH